MTDTDQFDYGQVSSALEAELRLLADAIRRDEQDMTAAGVRVGQALLNAKDHLEHGAFLSWCKLEVGFEARTAQNYMKLAHLYANHGEDVCRLGLSVAYALAGTSVDQQVVKEILSRATRGERLTAKSVQDFISAAGKKFDKLVSDRMSAIIGLLVEPLAPGGRELVREFLADHPPARRFLAELHERVADKNHTTAIC